MNATTNTPDLSAAAQRARLLDSLRAGPVSTLAARRDLCVMHPAARIQELREQGHDIATVWRSEPDERGVMHRQALYVLRAGEEVAA
jgi:hypothetical protein